MDNLSPVETRILCKCDDCGLHGNEGCPRADAEEEAIKQHEKPQVSPSNSNDWLCTIPYKFMKNGYVWSLLSVKNDFSKPESETFVHGEYENQYGHIKQFTLKEFRA